MIELMDVRKVFNMGKPNEFVAIHGVSLSIDSNKVTVLRGPSGSGKDDASEPYWLHGKAYLREDQALMNERSRAFRKDF